MVYSIISRSVLFEIHFKVERERENLTREAVPVFYESHFQKCCFKLNQHLGNVASGHREKGIKENFMMILGYTVKLQAAG